jgi:hypothetical protein
MAAFYVVTQIQESVLPPIFDTYLNAMMSNSNVPVYVRDTRNSATKNSDDEKVCFKKLDPGSFVFRFWTHFLL